MKRTVVLVAIVASALQAQYLEMAATADASEFHFASGYGLKDEMDTFGIRRIYRYQPGQPEVLARGGLPSFSGLMPVTPYLSDDGQTRGWFTNDPCFGSCMLPIARGGVVLTRNGKTFEQRGQAMRVSRNGRWFFDSGFVNFGPDPRLVNIDTGEVTNLPKLYPLHPTHAVADDGTLVTNLPGVSAGVLGEFPMTIRITPLGQAPVDIPFTERVISAAISADGARVLALTQSGILYAIDRNTLARRIVYTAKQTPVRFSPSSNGLRVLLKDGDRLIFVDAAGVRDLGESGGEFLLSGDGGTVFLVSASNELVKVAVDSGDRFVLYEALPRGAQQTTQGAVPGSLLRLSGGPFSDRQTMQGGGREFPVVAIAEDSYEVQIPWDFKEPGADQFILTTVNSPFVIRLGLTFSTTLYPAVYNYYRPTSTVDEMKAAQQDFGSLVSKENPAPAGSTIHFWVTGLGPLDRQLANGERGPVDPPAKPLIPLACFMVGPNGAPNRELILPFIAYAPGLVGVYQIDAMIPEDWPSPTASIFCHVTGSYLGSPGTIYVAKRP